MSHFGFSYRLEQVIKYVHVVAKPNIWTYPQWQFPFFQLLYIQQESSKNVTTVTLFLVMYSK